MNRSLITSASLLLASNLIALAIAIVLRWDLFEVVVLYWIQAFFIAVFQRRKIRDMIAYTLHPSRRKRYVLYSNAFVREGLHNAFAVIYGLFWAMEGGLLLSKYLGSDRLSVEPLALVLASAVFAVSHQWSYRANKEGDERRVVTIGNTVLHPLFRMFLPLHIFTLTVSFDGSFNPAAIAAWMLVKTVVDVGLHIQEHKVSESIALS